MTYTKLSAKLALFTAVSALTHTALAQAAPAGSQSFNSPPLSQAPAPSPALRVEKTWVSPPASTSLFSASAASARPLRLAAPIPSTKAASAARETSSSAQRWNIR
jgi:hypothetical protein